MSSTTPYSTYLTPLAPAVWTAPTAASSPTSTPTFPCGNFSSPSAWSSNLFLQPKGLPIRLSAALSYVDQLSVREAWLTRALCTIVPAKRSDSSRMAKTGSRHYRALVLAIFLAPPIVCSYASAQEMFKPIPQFPLSNGPLIIRQTVQPQHPFTVTGATGAILGLQNGNVELWELPTKVFSNLHLSAKVDGYPVPIDLNAAAATIDVQPDHTSITYSHAAITVRQHMFIPAGESNQAKGAIIFFEIESIRPAILAISFEPVMAQEWPAPTFGRPSAYWRPIDTGGAFVLSTDNPAIFGMVGMPNATSGPMAPYQERPQALPLQLKLRFDPTKDQHRFFPMIMEVSGPMKETLTHLSPQCRIVLSKPRRLCLKSTARHVSTTITSSTTV